LTRLAKLANMLSMLLVNTHEAKTTLSLLIKKALAGEEVVIAQANFEKLTLLTADEKLGDIL